MVDLAKEIPDVLSRQPLQDTQRKSNVEDRHVNFNKSHAIPVAMTINTVITDVKVNDEQNFVSGYRCLLKVSPISYPESTVSLVSGSSPG
ncbi:hypothetical protein OS493_020857 [Desmophyllum pertusum]|uniref:Uncharacterized protein n=1 Tax=Desmophyllum pertusum TaxID=174260 RepID=A0A9W9YBL2_9CNID|nr:hypothetical protein OS493_020857 [Desmophyllum pertusum]